MSNTGGRLTRLGTWVALARFPLVPVAAGVLLGLPSLWVGIQADDFQLRAAVLEQLPLEDAAPSPWAPYTWMDGVPAHNHEWVDLGWMPWWADPYCKASMMRPVTAATLMADYYWWPDYPALAHGQSMVWYGLVVWLASLWYRRVLGTCLPVWVAGLACLMFAVDESHATPVGWLANRNTLLTAFFGLGALVLQDKWRRDGWTMGAILGPVAFFVALMAKEEGVAISGYLLAYAIFLDRGPIAKRVICLLPFALAGMAWLVLYRVLGHGVFSSNVYADPLTSPLLFLSRVIDYGPILLLGQWALPVSDISNFLSAAAFRLHWVVALLVMAVVVYQLFPIVRRERTARFFALGSVLAVVPMCGVFPSDRLLLLVGLGSFGLLALWFHRWRYRFDEEGSWHPRVRGIFGRVMVVVHLAIAPLMFPVMAVSMYFTGGAFTKLFDSLPADADLARQSVINVNSYAPLAESLSWHYSTYRGRSVPLRSLTLAPACMAAEITRTDSRTLVVRPEAGYLAPKGELPGVDDPPLLSFGYLGRHLDHLVRSRDRPMRLGERIELTIAQIEITELTEDGRPAEATFRFRVPLADPSLRWFMARRSRYVGFTPPSIGETVRVSSPLE